MKLQKQIDSCRTGLKKMCERIGCSHTSGCVNVFCLIRHAMSCLDELEQEAAALEQSISAEKQASFRLGQMDMRESAAAALRNTADKTAGNTRSALLIAADVIKDLGVID